MIRAFVAKRAASFILTAAITGTAIAPAPARAVVYATEQTQLLVLAKEVETVINTVKQLEYSARMLSGLSMNSADDVVRGMQQVRAIMGVLNPAIESINASDDLFRRCWPEEYQKGISQRDLAGKVQEWRRVSEAAMRESWRVEAAAVAEQQAAARRVVDLVAASQAAPGQTAAIQAGNQLLASLSGQIANMQSTTLAHQRAVETVMAAEVNDVDRQRAMGDDLVKDSPGWARINGGN
jgi:type IV secretion system protein TrbJ